MKRVSKYAFIVVLSTTGFHLAWFASQGQSIAPKQSIPSTFEGMILAASDADMLGGAYADGVLNKVEGVEDSLSLVWVEDGTPKLQGPVHASNSVISWPSIVAWRPQSNMAYVAETRA
ncbi:MAG: hypothetical protein AAGA85_12170, partial [Bacteroidota bacterium]